LLDSTGLRAAQFDATVAARRPLTGDWMRTLIQMAAGAG